METAVRPQETAEDIIIRECAMMGEIRRQREENAKLRTEVSALEARHRRERAARMARYRREIEAEKQKDERLSAFLQGAAIFLSGVGMSMLLWHLVILCLGG